MKLRKRKRSDLQTLSDYILNPEEIRRSAFQEKKNEDTAARVKQILAQLNDKNYIVLAKAESDSGGADYEIRMGGNHAVFCSCKGWQFSKTGTCKHLERYKQQVKPIVVRKS